MLLLDKYFRVYIINLYPLLILFKVISYHVVQIELTTKQLLGIYSGKFCVMCFIK